MTDTAKSLIVLTLGCTTAATIYGLGSEIFSWKSAYAGDFGRVQLIQLSRVLVYITLGAILVLRGSWWGILAAMAMVLGATVVGWALFPFTLEWAATTDPAGYAERFGNPTRPTTGSSPGLTS